MRKGRKPHGTTGKARLDRVARCLSLSTLGFEELQDEARRHQAEADLCKAHASNDALLDAIPDSAFRVRKDGKITVLKLSEHSGFVLMPPGLSGHRLDDLPDRSIREELRRSLALTFATGQLQTCTFERGSGNTFRAVQARVALSGPDEAIVLLRDLTETRRLQNEILDISARERRRVSHDLHDGLGQLLAGIACKVKMLEQDLAGAHPGLASAAAELRALVKEATAQTRILSSGLDPLEVEAGELTPALERLAADSERLFQVRCECNCCRLSQPLSPTVGVNLYRIAQEAIRNSALHGRARRLAVDLTVAGQLLRLHIGDDGVGFQPEKQSGPGLGLRIMRHRANAIGASFAIRSSPGRGVHVDVALATPCPGLNCSEPSGMPQRFRV